MKVCMLGYTFYEVDNRVRRYAEALAKRGDEVEAVVLGKEGQAKEETISGVRVHRIQTRVRDERHPMSYLIKILTFFWRSMSFLAKRQMKARYDVIHVHSVPDFEVFATIVPWLMGTRVILDIHDIVPEFYASKFGVGERSLMLRLLRLVERLSCKYANHVIISNHLWYKKLTARSVSVDKCTPIINYPDPEIFSPRFLRSSQPNEFVMCYPGTLSWHQGVDLAIRAMVVLRERAPNLRLLIIGDGPDREKLKAMIREHDMGDQISLVGMIPLENVAEIMASVDLGVVPKRRNSFGDEAFSTKIMEFMAMGVPVLASNTRIDQWYFNEGQVQFFESENVDDLAAKIMELMNDTANRNRLRTRGMQFIEKNNWGLKKSEYFTLLDHVARPRGALA